MWEDELLERIASTSATNIEAGLRDRVRELRHRGMSWTRIGIALGMSGTRREAGLGRHLEGDERLVRGQALAEAA